jgi:LmbE family N-acetylglucosaminyl deacetylase
VLGVKVLAISVHPDDETLGCGGTLLKHAQNNDETHWLILTESLECVGYSEEYISQRELQIKEVSSAFRFTSTRRLGFPTTRLHAVDFTELISGISTVLDQVRPEVIYTVNRSDIHTDHQIAAKAVQSSAKSFRCPYIKRILMYECLSETEMAGATLENVFLPNAFSDITGYLDQKTEIMRIYGTELQETPLPRSVENIKALARFRGATAGVEFAEAFMSVREIF